MNKRVGSNQMNNKWEELQKEYNELQLMYKKQSRELALLKKKLERNKKAEEVKDNMNRVIAAKRSELERYMNLLMENSPDIVLLFDASHRIVYSSTSFLKNCGIPAFGIIKGTYYRRLLEPYIKEDVLERIDSAFLQIFNEKKTVELTEEIDFEQDGKLRNYSVRITPMIGERGIAEGAMMFFYDTTELIRAKQEAERANAAKSDFLATVSHEIRTPMHAIVGVSNMLKSTGLDDKQHEYLKNIQNSSNILLNLINDILDFSKIDAGKLELIPEYFELQNLLLHLQSMFELMFKQKGLSFICDFSADIPEVVYGDESRIRQILTNILNNALKYTEKGVVVFRVTTEGSGCLCFAVEDTGIGIKEEARSKLFIAFEQLDTVRNKKVRGTGLGLAITQHLCELMDGKIEVDSKYGKGSCFTVYLTLPKGTKQNLPAKHGKDRVDFIAPDVRILLVDDIEINLEITEYFLSWHQIKTDLSLSGQEAIEKVGQQDYDLIFMDHMMPEMDGVETTHIIRSMGGDMENIPIIALTANAVSGAVEMFMENGFSDFLAKPVDDTVLSECLLKWLPQNKIIMR